MQVLAKKNVIFIKQKNYKKIAMIEIIKEIMIY